MKKFLLALLVCALFLFLKTESALAAGTMERVYGLNRYQTAVQIAFKINPGTIKNVILANGNSFADSLAGVPLAKQKEAPLLYVNNTPEQSSDALLYIQNHLAANGQIYILGGTGVVPDTFITTLVNMGFSAENIHRLGGSNRYETAVEIAKQVNNNGTEFFIASGEDFPDALSGSVRAADLGDITQEEANYLTANGQPTFPVQGGVPILLVPSDGTVPSCVTDYLNSVKTPKWWPKQSFHILGSTSAVPDSVIDSLTENVNRFAMVIGRYSGNDRYSTMEAINKDGFDIFSVQSGLGKVIPHVYVATGESFPDALAGAVLAAINHAPLVLLSNDLPAPSLSLLAHYDSENQAAGFSQTTLTVIGDNTALTTTTVSKIQAVFQ